MRWKGRVDFIPGKGWWLTVDSDEEDGQDGGEGFRFKEDQGEVKRWYEKDVVENAVSHVKYFDAMILFIEDAARGVGIMEVYEAGGTAGVAAATAWIAWIRIGGDGIALELEKDAKNKVGE